MARPAAALLLLALLLLPAAHAVAQGLGPGERALLSLSRPGERAVDALLAARGARVLEDFGFVHVQLVEGPRDVLASLARLPGVAGVYPEERLQLLLSTSRPAVRVTPQVWDAGVDGSGVAVAVVDSGIDEQHPGMAGRVVRSVRVDGDGVRAGSGDRDGHGTHIAGIVAGDGGASADRRNAGMAPKASLVAVDISSSFTTTNAVRAFRWLHEHAQELGLRVVSNSWGREKEGASYDPDDPVTRASDALVEDGMVVVFSAGNRGPGAGTLTVEAQNPNVVTVGASDDSGGVEGYSSRGPARLGDGSRASWTKPDLLAPGSLITSARAGGRGEDAYVTINGTSMAAPHVAGIAALLLSAAPQLGPKEVKDLLLRGARDVGRAGPDDDAGAGFVDALAAVQLATQGQAEREPAREPFRGDGSVTPAAGLLPAGLGSAQSEVRHAVLVPERAVGIDLTFRWDDPQASFLLYLERGGQRLGPLGAAAERNGWREIHTEVQQALAPGSWDVVARSSGASAQAHYQMEGAVLVRLAPASLPAGFGAGGRGGGFDPLDVHAVAEQGALGWLLLAPLGALALLAWRRRAAAFEPFAPGLAVHALPRAPPRAPPRALRRRR